jgi:hypothetical protein
MVRRHPRAHKQVFDLLAEGVNRHLMDLLITSACSFWNILRDHNAGQSVRVSDPARRVRELTPCEWKRLRHDYAVRAAA